MQVTPRLGMPLLAVAQAQKEITHNEALVRLDRLVQAGVKGRRSAPPAAVMAGDAWLVTAGTAEWAGMDGRIAVFMGAGWDFEPAFEGLLLWVEDEGAHLIWRDGWQALWPVRGLLVEGRPVLAAPAATVALPSGGSVVDSEARAVLVQLVSRLQEQGLLL
jgi:hypothetical protein